MARQKSTKIHAHPYQMSLKIAAVVIIEKNKVILPMRKKMVSINLGFNSRINSTP
jgi:hypothetical protein